MADDKGILAEEVVESLIQGRARRSTAGRHLSALLNAEADDELALLFEEVDDDNEFSINAAEEPGEDEDMGLDSSSDDEDQGPNARDDDYEGEQEIEKQAKADRQKRKARDELRLKLARKKVKIDPTAVPAVPAPRPKKKSERISWLPTVEDGPTRSSSRRQTMQNKELTHARLKDSEEKRIRLIATMEEAAKRKALLKPKRMTQAERLAEAERVERLNSKSLSRWEEMEKRKAEERRAKIEALQNRRLEGPVISYWSGVATWVNGRLTRVGKVNITPKPEKEETTRKKSKKTEKEEKNATGKTAEAAAVVSGASQSAPPVETANPQVATGEGDSANKVPLKPGQIPEVSQETGTTTGPSNTNAVPVNPPAPSDPAATAETKSAPPIESPTSVPESGLLKIETKPDKEQAESKATDEAPKDGNAVAAGLETPGEAARNPTQAAPAPTSEQPKPEVLPSAGQSDEPSKETIAEASASDQSATRPPATPQVAGPLPTVPDPATALTPADLKQEAQVPAPQQEQVAPENAEIQVDQSSVPNGTAPHPQIPAPPSVVEQTGRCLTILEDFDEETAQSREFSIYFNAKKPPRLTKISSSLCVITSLPSRYRDPETSLPFANAYAYREIRRTVAQRSSWSPMLGCYVGPVGVAARGVPERFLNPQAPSVTKEGERRGANNDGDGERGPTSAVEKTEGGVSNRPAPAPTPTPVATSEPMDIDIITG